jgi:hypothetical protein
LHKPGMEMQHWVALSAIVAAASFAYAVLTRRKAERDAELRAWQRVVIYSLIEEAAPILFEELKSRYLQRAKDLLSRRVPQKVIRDDSLKRILLDLQKDGVIVRDEKLSYQVRVKLPIEASALEEFKRIERAKLIKPRLLAVTDDGSAAPRSVWLRQKH